MQTTLTNCQAGAYSISTDGHRLIFGYSLHVGRKLKNLYGLRGQLGEVTEVSLPAQRTKEWLAELSDLRSSWTDTYNIVLQMNQWSVTMAHSGDYYTLLLGKTERIELTYEELGWFIKDLKKAGWKLWSARLSWLYPWNWIAKFLIWLLT